MTQRQFLLDYLAWFAVVVFWTGLLAPAVTALFWRWWKSVWGWNIVSLELCLSGLLLEPSVEQMSGFRISPFSLFWLWLDVFLITAAAGIMVWRTIVVYGVQVRGAEDDVARLPGSQRPRDNGGIVRPE